MRETKSSKRLGRGSALRRRERNKMLYFQVREKKWLERKKKEEGRLERTITTIKIPCQHNPQKLIKKKENE